MQFQLNGQFKRFNLFTEILICVDAICVNVLFYSSPQFIFIVPYFINILNSIFWRLYSWFCGWMCNASYRSGGFLHFKDKQVCICLKNNRNNQYKRKTLALMTTTTWIFCKYRYLLGEPWNYMLTVSIHFIMPIYAWKYTFSRKTSFNQKIKKIKSQKMKTASSIKCGLLP